MAKIQLLDAKIANMIAAGEVVERPAGVVKELVENAIDAQSTRIEIHAKEGGIRYLEVIDNGSGMNKEDVLMAFQRHATSKIQKESDLWNIQTLGFRGEALPSIASVSDVWISSCDGTQSTVVILKEGKVADVQPGVFRQGTQIRVEHLFYALPARLKHLKAIPYEFSLVLDLVQKLALVNPTIAFLLTHDGKEIFRSNGNGDMKEILYAIYGRDVAKAAVSIHAANDDFTVGGYLILPHINRSNRYHMVTFLNDRLIKSYRLQQAVLEGYHDFLSEKRYPMVFLTVAMDYKLIDVNVHPSKWEVRLSKEQQLYELIQATIAATLRQNLHQGSAMIPERAIEKKLEQAPTQLQWSPYATTYRNPAPIVKEVVSLPQYNNEIVENNPQIVEKQEVIHKETAENGEKEALIVENKVEIVDKMEDVVENDGIPEYLVIGQLHGSYILCQNEKGLVILDQHAANERIRYEEILKQLEQEEMQVQPLLLPLVLHVGKSTMMRMSEIEEFLQTLGIRLEPFGEQELLCRELPLWIQKEDETAFLMDMISLLLEQKRRHITQFKKHEIATLACHTSVRFNRYLAKEEMEVLVQRLFRCENPYHCPHGRPTMIEYETSALRKLFDRG